VKPVAIVQFSPDDGPAYFRTYLERHSIPIRVIRCDFGERVPVRTDAYAGIGLMGGPMSANDPLEWIAPVLALIRTAVTNEVPVIGHCLGGQLMSKALGGTVLANPIVEIGWGTVHVEDNPAAHHWFGPIDAFESFHWHGETFTIPPGATRIATNAFCGNRAFALGKHLGMQCHVEMTPEAIRTWCANGADEIAARAGPAVNSIAEIETRLPERSGSLSAVATRLYDRWSEGLAR
jgi:GMP synthase-like glutamine amidotransferase